MSVRDVVLPALDKARAKIAAIGLRRYRVIIRRRAWSGASVGQGTEVVTDLELSPRPETSFEDGRGQVAESAGTISDRDIEIASITPAYSVNGVTGGYTPAQLNPKANGRNEEIVVVLIGDDG